MDYQKIANSKNIIFLLLAWQLFSVGMLIFAGWPNWVVWLNLVLGLLFILLADTFHGILFVIISVPFYLALPSNRFPALSEWRVWFAALFAVFLWRQYLSLRRQRLGFSQAIYVALSDLGQGMLPWDKYLAWFAGMAILVTLIFAPFRVEGLKQILFWVNVYLLYVVIVNAIKTKQQIVETIKFAAASLGIVVAIGYFQLVITFFTSITYFWDFWAIFISRLYYGPALANVLLYSNSWFSYSGGGTELRMFSIMPDSHSFAMLAVFASAFLLPLVYLIFPKREKTNLSTNQNLQKGNQILGIKIKYSIWLAIVFSGLAVILSGTRAVWAGLLAPLVLLLIFYFKKFCQKQTRLLLASYFIIVLLFILSPFINQGLNLLRVGKFQENFLSRAKTIYDLNDISNADRLKIWKGSLKFAATHPWGVGVGNFLVTLAEGNSASQTDYQQFAAQHNKEFNLPQEFVTAHNLYLQELVEVGIVGLLLFLAFWLKYFYVIVRFIQKYLAKDDLLIFFVFEIAITFLWILCAGLFDVTLFNDKVLIFSFISLALSGVIIKNYQLLENT